MTCGFDLGGVVVLALGFVSIKSARVSRSRQASQNAKGRMPSRESKVNGGRLRRAGTVLRRHADLRRMEEFGLWPRFVALAFNGTKKSLELGNHFAPLLFRERLNEGRGVV